MNNLKAAQIANDINRSLIAALVGIKTGYRDDEDRDDEDMVKIIKSIDVRIEELVDDIKFNNQEVLKIKNSPIFDENGNHYQITLIPGSMTEAILETSPMNVTITDPSGNPMEVKYGSKLHLEDITFRKHTLKVYIKNTETEYSAITNINYDRLLELNVEYSEAKRFGEKR